MWTVIVAAIFALVRLILPSILSKLGEGGALLIRALDIIMWAVILIAVIYIVFALVSCLLGSGGVLPPLPHR